MKRISVTLPEDVVDYYQRQGVNTGTSASAAAAPVLCAKARDEIKQMFFCQPGTELRPR